MAPPVLMPVAEALARITGALHPVGVEIVNLAEAFGRVLAQPLAANRTQPPTAVSAMDGYAVRAQDVAEIPARLRLAGHAPAGAAFAGTVGQGQAVRIFTGGPVPAGADTVIIQEDTEAAGDAITIRQAAPAGKNIRSAGTDFHAGQVLLRAGKQLGARDISLAAAMNIPWLPVRRRPRIALLATGDELVRPGEAIGPHQIVSSNSLGIAALIRACGGEVTDLGIAADNREELRSMASGARGADMLVTLGGASVGDHDLVQSVLGEVGLQVDFWKIAMRPGKPLIFGHMKETPMLGLPGNPVSAMVCGLVFLAPAIAALLGKPVAAQPERMAVLGADLPVNDNRQDYLRASLCGEVVTAFAKQDSSQLSTLSQADCLIVRPPFAPAARAGDMVQIMLLESM